MKRVFFLVSIITFEYSQAMQAEIEIRPLILPAGIGVVVSGKVISPRQPTTPNNSPRKSALALQASGEKILHPLLVRAASERRLLTMEYKAEELKKLNEVDKYPAASQVPRRSSGSSSRLSASGSTNEVTESAQEDEKERNDEVITSIIYRRNTIST